MLATRYIFKKVLTATIFIAIVLTAVIWLTQSLKVLDRIATSDAPLSLFLQMTLLILPKFLENILPISLIIAILFVYNKMIVDNELVVMRSCGLDQYSLAKPAVKIAAIMAVILLGLTTYVSPLCFTKMKVLSQDVQAKYAALLLREGVFNAIGDDFMVYFRTKEENGDFNGIVIYDAHDKKNPPVTVMAKRGQFVVNGSSPEILIYDGIRQQMDRSTGTLSKLYFASYALEIEKRAQKPGKYSPSIDERTLPELLVPGIGPREAFLTEASSRLIAPLNALGFAMVALTAILLGPFNRQGQGKKIAVAGLFIVGLEVLSFSIGNSARHNLYFLPFLYILTLLPIAGGFFLLRMEGEQWLMGLIRDLGNLVSRLNGDNPRDLRPEKIPQLKL